MRTVLLTLGFVVALVGAPIKLVAFETQATSAFVLDHSTGTVLLSKDADVPLPPASMSKLMTLYVAFEAVRDGRLKMDDTLRVSEHAMSYGGSTMFLQAGERVKVSDLITGIIVLSGNDACAVIAEALSPDGTEAGFSRFMTERAKKLGMTHSTFANSNGWPNPRHRMSMRDLAILGGRIIDDFPEFYTMFSQKEFLFDEKESQNRFNRNPLLGLGIGADGLKTGHTQEAGYGLVGSVAQGSRRIIFVISGLQTEQARAREAEAITNWAFRQFTTAQLLQEGQVVAEADVWMGETTRVALTAGKALNTLVPSGSDGKVDAEVVYNGPLRAPVTAGDTVGTLIIRPEGLAATEVPLVAATSVAQGGVMVRLKTASRKVMKKLLAEAEGAL
ncbi:D-alanyl-D-alanine carboxypeptidase family protein [uncultured Lentibacter sp.]|uniref:D-alanyl-D-alanine carboxypeptidase family protein n=1 Tax=uncultured Lentibacter sp. TaxID=1659309 RepID=UPI00262908CC|nr:D-alanyl-D-alanine carboxypeptidase family protein [uncultured Lentibacter sp.]